MSRKSCETCREELVEFADGELDTARAARISDHLAACPACRRQLAALQTSLSLARELWAEASPAPLSTAQAAGGRPHEIRRWSYRLGWGAAAAIFLLLGYLVLPPGPKFVTPAKPPQVSAAEIEREIQDAGLAAQMLLAGDMLAQTPGGAPYATDCFLSITLLYPKTEAAGQARVRLTALKERPTP